MFYHPVIGNHLNHGSLWSMRGLIPIFKGMSNICFGRKRGEFLIFFNEKRKYYFFKEYYYFFLSRI
jgi:hypothetical protein